MRYILAVLALWTLPAESHSWYPLECCSVNDCSPAKPSQVRRVPGGFQIGNETIPIGDPRIRPIPPNATNEDGTPASGVHVCITPTGVRCLFLGGFDG